MLKKYLLFNFLDIALDIFDTFICIFIDIFIYFIIILTIDYKLNVLKDLNVFL